MCSSCEVAKPNTVVDKYRAPMGPSYPILGLLGLKAGSWGISGLPFCWSGQAAEEGRRFLLYKFCSVLQGILLEVHLGTFPHRNEQKNLVVKSARKSDNRKQKHPSFPTPSPKFCTDIFLVCSAISNAKNERERERERKRPDPASPRLWGLPVLGSKMEGNCNGTAQGRKMTAKAPRTDGTCKGPRRFWTGPPLTLLLSLNISMRLRKQRAKNTVKSKWGLSKWGLSTIAYDCCHFAAKVPLKKGPKRGTRESAQL